MDDVKTSYKLEDVFPNLVFNRPVGIYKSGDGSDRFFVVDTVYHDGQVAGNDLPQSPAHQLSLLNLIDAFT